MTEEWWHRMFQMHAQLMENYDADIRKSSSSSLIRFPILTPSPVRDWEQVHRSLRRLPLGSMMSPVGLPHMRTMMPQSHTLNGLLTITRIPFLIMTTTP